MKSQTLARFGSLSLLAAMLGGCGSAAPVRTSHRSEPNDNPPEPMWLRGPTVTTTQTAMQVSDNPFLLSGAGIIAAGPPDEPVTFQRPVRTPRPAGEGVAFQSGVMAKAMNANPDVSKGGTNFTQVSFSQEGADFDPDVSRDGRTIVFASTQHRNTSDIYIKNVESRVVTQLTNDPANDVMPKVSPDGTRIAFASNRSGNWDIFVMPIAGGKAIQLTNCAADDLHATWSPDGSHLVFCRMGEVSGQWEMWVTDVGNSGVARFIGYGLFPEWCPVGGTGAAGADRIVFQKSRERGDRAFGIWTIDYKDGQSGNLTEIAASPLAACINPSWSQDGQWLAYATVPNPGQWAHATGGRPPAADLWMVDINGSSRISLTSGTAVNLMPAWGPGNRIFFVSDRGGNDNIWEMDTSKVVELAQFNMKSSSAFAAKQPAAGSSHETGNEAPMATVPGADGEGREPR